MIRVMHSRTPLYKCIPTVHCRIAYFNKMEEYYKKVPKVPFEQKKFILFISKNALNQNKGNLSNYHLQKQGFHGTLHHSI